MKGKLCYGSYKQGLKKRTKTVSREVPLRNRAKQSKEAGDAVPNVDSGN